MTSVFIIVFNGFFYTLTYPMVQKIGLHQHTKETALTTMIIFVCLSTDMILLPILIGYNVAEYGEDL